MKQGIFWILLVTGLVLIVNLSRSVFDLVNRGAVLEEAQEELAQARKDNIRLQDEFETSETNFFVEQQAREKLNMAREGETVVIVPTAIPPSPTPTPTPIRHNWELWRDEIGF